MRPRSSRQLSTTGGAWPMRRLGMRRDALAPRDRSLEGRRGRGDVLGRDAAAAADDLRALLAPLERKRRVRLRVDPLVEAPELTREVAEVGVDAERELGEVAEPADHARHVIDGQAVDEQGADAHLLEAACGATEEITLRRAPVLAVDAADAVTAAAERDPDGEAELEELLDEGERLGLADQRERLEQDQVGLLVVEDLREQARRAAPGERLGVLRERERDRARSRDLRRGGSREPDAVARDVHPVQQAGISGPASLRLGKHGPRVRRDDVAARGDVRAMDVEHRLRSAVERPAAPEVVPRSPRRRRQNPLELGCGAPVEDDAPAVGELLLDPRIRLDIGRRQRHRQEGRYPAA